MVGIRRRWSRRRRWRQEAHISSMFGKWRRWRHSSRRWRWRSTSLMKETRWGRRSSPKRWRRSGNSLMGTRWRRRSSSKRWWHWRSRSCGGISRWTRRYRSRRQWRWRPLRYRLVDILLHHIVYPVLFDKIINDSTPFLIFQVCVRYASLDKNNSTV